MKDKATECSGYRDPAVFQQFGNTLFDYANPFHALFQKTYFLAVSRRPDVFTESSLANYQTFFTE